MTIQDQIDQLKKEFDEKIMQIKNEVTLLTGFTGGNHQEVKTTRYYPNGAYMDEPEMGTPYWIQTEWSEVVGSKKDGVFWEGDALEKERLQKQEIFPTEEAAEKELKRQKLTAKMYRDMRDERINGDWVADWDSDDEKKYHPVFKLNDTELRYSWKSKKPHNFYYRNCTFFEDLKALGWTEEELKIVWFNN